MIKPESLCLKYKKYTSKLRNSSHTTTCVGLFQYQHVWREQKFEILKIWKRNWRMLSYPCGRYCASGGWRMDGKKCQKSRNILIDVIIKCTYIYECTYWKKNLRCFPRTFEEKGTLSTVVIAPSGACKTPACHLRC